MKSYNLSYVILLQFLILIGHLSRVSGNNEQDSDLRLYQCKIKAAAITNIDIISRQELFDAEGNPVRNIKQGVAELYITGDKISTPKDRASILVTMIDNMEAWKAQPKNLSDGAIVGLIEESVDALIFLGSRCWLLRIHSGKIYSLEVEVIIAMSDVNVATMKIGAKPKISDNPELVASIFKMLNNPNIEK